uniref:Uncharacterized protein n=1 Tax=Acrobeloides nanus TaxID=290746 RepID=A0A914EGZ2_9BILA
MDPRIEPFVYPLYNPTGTFGWHDGLTYADRAQKRLTHLKFAQYRLTFRRCYDTQEPISMPLTIGIDFSQQYETVPAMPFNQLHFGEQQQYCVDSVHSSAFSGSRTSRRSSGRTITTWASRA